MRNPLLDIDFLRKLDENKSREVYAKVIALTFDEQPTEEISGKVTQGSVNIDGTSAIRRSCSLTLIAKDVNINDFYWGLNTKFKLFIGLKNTIDDRYDDIIWFKQGTFLITSFNTSLSTNNYSISISGKDKMCLLNGDIGGAINSLSVDFGTYDEIDEDGNTVTYDYPIKEIVKEAVHTYANEPYHNIIINDLDEIGFELMEYRGDVDVFMLIDTNSSEVTNMKFNDEDTQAERSSYYNWDTKSLCTLDQLDKYDTRMSELDFNGNNITEFTHISPITITDATYNERDVIQTINDYTINEDIVYTVARITYGDTCGYRITDLTYAGDLIGQVGSSITSSVLDKIVSMLGEYEYFYNLDGQFVFQRKQTYTQNSWNSISNDGESGNNRDSDYADSAAYSSAFSYSFTDSNLITSFQNTPNLQNLRNDFSIWGERTSSSGSTIPIHLRYAIDIKPEYYKAYDGTIYTTKDIPSFETWIEEITNQAREEITAKIISIQQTYNKKALPVGLSDDWWEVHDWAEYYKQLTGEYPNQRMGDYVTEWTQLDLNDYFPAGSKWDYNWPLFLFDVNDDGTLGFIGHNPVSSRYSLTEDGHVYDSQLNTVKDDNFSCGHKYYDYFVTRNITAYFYKPTIPQATLTTNVEEQVQELVQERTGGITTKEQYEEVYTPIADWREIIYQMAKDNLKNQHEDDFLATIAANNPDYYPTGYTGYEPYYIDMQGFWRYLYNPELTPLNLDHVVPDVENNHYYIWNEDTQEFTDYTFKEATDIAPLDSNTTYYYYNGTVALETLIAKQQAKKDAIDKAKIQREKELKSMDADNYSSVEVYNQAVQNVKDKYQAIIDENTDGFIPKFLDIKTTDTEGNVTYDNDLTDQLIAKYYPTYEEVDPHMTWKDYEPYIQYTDDGKYFLLQLAKDLTTLSAKDDYYYLDDTDNQFHIVNDKTDVPDTTAKQNEDGSYPNKTVPQFKLGKRYYIYEGYAKVSALEIGTLKPLAAGETYAKGNAYYSYGAYKLASTYNADVTYYTRTLQDGENLFEKAVVNEGNFDITKHYILVTAPNNSDKTLVKGYCLLLQMYDKEYYTMITDSTGKTITSTPTYFTRGKTYYSNDADGNPQVEFTFEKGVVYYLYKGFTEVLDLTNFANASDSTIVVADGSGLKTGYYYQYADTDKTIVDKFTLGYIYYGYIQQDNNDLSSGAYYTKNDNGTFTEKQMLRAFKRGATYYIRDYGYDLIENVIYTAGAENKYYVDTGSDYVLVKTIINKYRSADGTISTENAKKLLSTYGIGVFTDGSIDKLGQAYNFYTHTYHYREVSYYVFGFYKVATQYDANAEYYAYQNKEYEYVGKLSRQDYASSIYFLKLDNSTIQVYLTDEFNVHTYWTFKLDYPETLTFWFDFLNVNGDYVARSVTADDIATGQYYVKDGTEYSRARTYDSSQTYYEFVKGELAQYSVHSIGDRPKTVNDKDVKAIYYRDTPTVIFLGVDGAYIQVFLNQDSFDKGTYYQKTSNGTYELATKYAANKDYYRRMEAADKKSGYTYINLTDTVDNLFSISSQGKTAFDQLDTFLYNYSYCTESITVNAVPVYYLEPNTRIFIEDTKSGISGEYILTKITLPLQYNGTMSLTATKAVKNIK